MSTMTVGTVSIELSEQASGIFETFPLVYTELEPVQTLDDLCKVLRRKLLKVIESEDDVSGLAAICNVSLDHAEMMIVNAISDLLPIGHVRIATDRFNNIFPIRGSGSIVPPANEEAQNLEAES